ncbi:MAG: hypothetical protein AAFR25_03020 [Cyanobacteria bacterium J06629_19]
MKDNVVMGTLCVVFFGLGIVVFTCQLCTKGDYLRLDYDGFTVCSLHRKQHVHWSMVEGFFPYVAYRHKMVGWRYRPDSAAGAAKSPGRSLTGVDGATPCTYGMQPEQLAALMNELRVSYQLSKYYSENAVDGNS